MFCKIVFLFVVPNPPRVFRTAPNRAVSLINSSVTRRDYRLSRPRDVLFFRAKKPPDISDGSDLGSLILPHFILFYTTERLN